MAQWFPAQTGGEKVRHSNNGSTTYRLGCCTNYLEFHQLGVFYALELKGDKGDNDHRVLILVQQSALTEGALQNSLF